MEIELTGIIGKDVDAYSFIKQFENKTDDLTIKINSPGGSIPKGYKIFDAIKKYKGNTIGIIGDGDIAASMASVIFQAFDKRIITETSTIMIHNAQTEVRGDHNFLQRVINLLKISSNKLATTYAQRTKKDVKEIIAFMDQEKSFFGQEIIDNGFADEIIKVENCKDQDDYILNCMFAVEDMKESFIDNITSSDIKNCLEIINTKQSIEHKEVSNPAKSGENKTNREVQKVMTKAELKQNSPELFAELEKEFEAVGAEKAYNNVKNHLKMVEFDNELVMKNIAEQKDFMGCVADYTALKIVAKKVEDTIDETKVVESNTATTSAVEKVDEVDEIMAQYEEYKGVK